MQNPLRLTRCACGFCSVFQVITAKGAVRDRDMKSTGTKVGEERSEGIERGSRWSQIEKGSFLSVNRAGQHAMAAPQLR
jgi:hypothetical protein